MRVGIVCPYSWDIPGGVQAHVRDLAEKLIELGHTVSVLAPGDEDMAGLPPAMFVVDVNHEKIAVAEAKRAGIPCVGLVDTNSDPTTLSHPIPGNDDAVKSIRIIVEAIVAGVQSGLAQRDTRRAQRGAADIKAAAAPEVAVAEGEIDLSKIEIPADLADVVEGAEGETEVIAPKKKALRPKKPAVKAE